MLGLPGFFCMIFRLDKHRIIYKQPPSILGVYLIFQPHIVVGVFLVSKSKCNIYPNSKYKHFLFPSAQTRVLLERLILMYNVKHAQSL